MNTITPFKKRYTEKGFTVARQAYLEAERNFSAACITAANADVAVKQENHQLPSNKGE
ncbi:hypothetical protein D3C77_362740 [compost metagenome]